MVSRLLPLFVGIGYVLVRVGGARPVGLPDMALSSLSRQPDNTPAISQIDKVFQAIDPLHLMRRLCDIPSLCLALPGTNGLPPVPDAVGATTVSDHTSPLLPLPNPAAALATAISDLAGALLPGSPSSSIVPSASPPVVPVAALPDDALSTTSDVPAFPLPSNPLATAITDLAGALLPGSPSSSIVPSASPPVVPVAALPDNALSTTSDVPVFPLPSNPQGVTTPQQTPSAAAPPPIAEVVFPSIPRNLPLPAAGSGASAISSPNGALPPNFLGLLSFAVADGPSSFNASRETFGPEAGRTVELNLRV